MEHRSKRKRMGAKAQFKTNVKDENDSLELVDQLLFACVSNILQVRNILPRDFFKSADFDGVELWVLLRKNLFGHMMGAMVHAISETIKKRYLHHLLLLIQPREATDDLVLEVYDFAFAYKDEQSVMEIRSSNGEVMMQFTFASEGELRKDIAKLFARMRMTLSAFAPLPPAKLNIKLLYYPNTPWEYEPQYFGPGHGLYKFASADHGGIIHRVATEYHGFLLDVRSTCAFESLDQSSKSSSLSRKRRSQSTSSKTSRGPSRNRLTSGFPANGSLAETNVETNAKNLESGGKRRKQVPEESRRNENSIRKTRSRAAGKKGTRNISPQVQTFENLEELSVEKPRSENSLDKPEEAVLDTSLRSELQEFDRVVRILSDEGDSSEGDSTGKMGLEDGAERTLERLPDAKSTRVLETKKPGINIEGEISTVGKKEHVQSDATALAAKEFADAQLPAQALKRMDVNAKGQKKVMVVVQMEQEIFEEGMKATATTTDPSIPRDSESDSFLPAARKKAKRRLSLEKGKMKSYGTAQGSFAEMYEKLSKEEASGLRRRESSGNVGVRGSSPVLEGFYESSEAQGVDNRGTTGSEKHAGEAYVGQTRRGDLHDQAIADDLFKSQSPLAKVVTKSPPHGRARQFIMETFF